MFVIISKALGFLFQASNLLVVAALASALTLHFGRLRLGRVLVWCTALGLLLIGFGPMGVILIRPLEDRFAHPPNDMPEPTGIIVLGGVISPLTTSARNAVSLSEDAERMTEAAALAHRYPNAMIVFSGGPPGDGAEAKSEAFAAKQFLVDLAVDESRIVLESRSLSTAENAVFTRELLNPQPGQRWLLVTSASHMPRAVGSFRRAGFSVIPYPVGYTTTGLPIDYGIIRFDASANFVRFEVAFHEWAGLIAYRLTGRIDALFPGPEADRS